MSGRRDARRRFLVGAASAALLGPAARAGAGEPSVLRVAGPWEIAGLDPSVGGIHFTRMQVLETLFEADDTGQPLPGLAARWWSAPDARTWRFTLRAGARFHDGTPLTAALVARALQRAAGRPGVLRLARPRRIEPLGDDLLLVLDAPLAALPALLANSTTALLAPASFDADGTVRRVVGSGPYRVTRLEPPYRFDVERWEGWGATAPTIARARYESAPRAETRLLMAESGQADLAFGLSPAGLARARRVSGLAVHTTVTPRTLILKVNAGHRWLADVRARRALSLAIDRRGIAAGLLRDAELAAAQLFPPSLAPWHDPTLAPLAFDPRAARALLASLGWTPGRDGMLERDGAPFRLTLRTFPDRPELPVVATALQEQLRQVGIAAKVLIGSSGSVPLGHRDGTLELALAARNYAVATDPLLTVLQDFAPGGGDWGAMNWTSDALAGLLDTLRGATDAATRDAACAAAARILHTELPVIPIAWHKANAAASTDLRGMRLDPLERSYRIGALRRGSDGVRRAA